MGAPRWTSNSCAVTLQGSSLSYKHIRSHHLACFRNDLQFISHVLCLLLHPACNPVLKIVSHVPPRCSRGVAAALNSTMPVLANSRARLGTAGSGSLSSAGTPSGVVEQEAQLGDLVAG